MDDAQKKFIRKWLANLSAAVLLLLASAIVGHFFESFILVTLGVWLLSLLGAMAIWEKTDGRGPREWLLMTAVAVVMTMISFLLDCLVGGLLNPEKGWIEAGTQTLGFLFTLFGVGTVICCLAGALRAWILLSGNEIAEHKV
jgi:hypothetical protein